VEAPHKRILLVDDELSWRRMLARCLGSRYEVVGVPSCEEAFLLLEREATGFDLILLDLSFGEGKMRGEVALPLFVQRWPSLPVAVLTAADTAAQAVQVLRLGATDYITKDECGSGGALAYQLDSILADINLSREIQVLQVLLEARLEARRLHSHQSPKDLPALPAEAARALDDVTRDYCAIVLRMCGHSIREAARRLRVPYSSLRVNLIRWRVVGAEDEAHEDQE
jgi:DNA-binding NtrC family response regulator